MQARAQREPLPAIAWGTAVTPTASKPITPTLEQRNNFDGYTAIAVFAIIVFTVYQFCNVNHFLYRGTPGYTLLNSLDAAVPWFFVLAAFKLFEPIARTAIDRSPTGSSRSLMVRRAIQIVPAYYVAVAVVWFSRQHSLPGDWRDLLEHLTFTQVFDEKRIFYTDGPAWAISVLVLFCLLLSVLNVGLIAICRRLHTRRQRIALLGLSIAVLAALSLTWKTWSFAVEHRPTTGSFTTWFGPTANLDNFAVGMAVALVTTVIGNRHKLSARQRFGLRSLATAILLSAFALRKADSWSSVYFSTACSISFGCLIAAVALKPNKVHRPSRSYTAPFTLVATVGYGAYLWHEPVLLGLRSWNGTVRQAPDAVLQDTLVVLVASLCAGWLSYSLIERPAQQLSQLITRQRGPGDGEQLKRAR